MFCAKSDEITRFDGTNTKSVILIRTNIGQWGWQKTSFMQTHDSMSINLSIH
jgi:hypothetical protein